MPNCTSCKITLEEPYIACTDCSAPLVHLCLGCFAAGYESASHQSDHAYEVLKTDFSVLDSGWSAAEELRLLDALVECGFGNWNDVANQVQKKSAADCETHYKRCYLLKPRHEFPAMPLRDAMGFSQCPLPYKASDDPPRPSDGSLVQQEMAGYLAGRGDFTHEHNNYAELHLQQLSYDRDDDPLEKRLCMAMVDVYRNVLKERQRRKRLIRRYGLIGMNKALAHCRQLEHSVGFSLVACLKPMSQLLSPVQWHFCLESLHLDCKLRRLIARLQLYRQAGLRTMQSTRLYDRLAAKRTERNKSRNLLAEVLDCIQLDYRTQPRGQRTNVLHSLTEEMDLNLPNISRRRAPPLDITGLPGCDKLTENEKKMCSNVRLVPESYLEFRRLLVAECTKHGQVSLAQARTLIKIDVNKTRKVHDFMLTEGLITCNQANRRRGRPTRTPAVDENDID